jgi:hypothetical protein
MRGHRPAQLCRAANRFDYRRLNCGELACFASLPLHPKFPFLAPSRETGSDMTARGVGSLVPSVSTIHTLKLYRSRDTRDRSATSKTCLPIFSASVVSARAIKANEANSASCLCSKKFRSWLGYRRPVRCPRGEHAVPSSHCKPPL